MNCFFENCCLPLKILFSTVVAIYYSDRLVGLSVVLDWASSLIIYHPFPSWGNFGVCISLSPFTIFPAERCYYFTNVVMWPALLFSKDLNSYIIFFWEISQQISSYLLPTLYIIHIFLILWQSQFFNREQTNSSI